MNRILVALGGVFILLLNLFSNKVTLHRHDYKKVLYYVDNVDKLELYSELRCSCGKRKKHEYVTTKYCYTVLKREEVMKNIKLLGYIPKEELEADLVALLDWIKEK